MRIFFLSLGCDKNLCDSEHMLALLRASGHTFTDSEEEAEVIVINTCCFIGDVKEESINEILRLAELKKTGTLKLLLVTGCLSERYQKELPQELPEVDGALGIASWDRLPELLEAASRGEHPMYFDNKDLLVNADSRVLTTGGHYAYLKIAEGCNKFCTYCIIPYIRGRFRSVPMEKLLAEAAELAEQGVKELILVAQETTVYGTDLYGKKTLPELVEKLSEIEGIEWIRLLYCYPEEITPELIETIKTNPKVVHYLDLPIQHCEDRILKAMNRRTTKAKLLETLKTLRTEIPDIALRTTLITGFPGETFRDARALLNFVKEAKFDRLGAFAYSQEEDTPAASFPGQVPEKLRAERRDRIMEAQQEIAFAKAESMIGRTLKVLVEGRITTEKDVYAGRTYMDAPDVDGLIFFRSDYDLMSGQMVDVTVNASSGYDLQGELAETED